MISRLFAGLFLAVLCGCTTNVTLYQVEGIADYDGKPIPKGVIYFDPQGEGPQGVATIENGKFTTAHAQGRGIVGGKHICRIEGFDGKPGQELPLGRLLFTSYEQVIDFPKANFKVTFDVPRKK